MNLTQTFIDTVIAVRNSPWGVKVKSTDGSAHFWCAHHELEVVE